MKSQNLNCGSCLFLSRDRIFERSCDALGKLATSKGCSSYTPDAFILAGSPKRVERLRQVSSAIKGMTVTEIQALGSLLQAEKATRKAGWSFYQRVVVRYSGTSASNYFSNFAIGHVVYADKDVVRIVGTSGKMMVTALNVKDSDTVYTLEQFKAISIEMTKKKHFIDRTNGYTMQTGPRVQSLDDALTSDATMNKKLTSSKTKTDDLVAIISKMSMGISPRKAPRRKTEDRRVPVERRQGPREIVMDGR